MINQLKAKSLVFLLLLSIWSSSCQKVENNQPVIRIGALNKTFQSDAVCTLVYQKKRILTELYTDKEFWMNLDGKDVQLIRTADKTMFQFKNGDLEAILDYGPEEECPSEGMDCTIHKNAKMTFMRGGKSFTIKALGGCDAGMDYGL